MRNLAFRKLLRLKKIFVLAHLFGIGQT